MISRCLKHRDSAQLGSVLDDKTCGAVPINSMHADLLLTSTHAQAICLSYHTDQFCPASDGLISLMIFSSYKDGNFSEKMGFIIEGKVTPGI